MSNGPVSGILLTLIFVSSFSSSSDNFRLVFIFGNQDPYFSKIERMNCSSENEKELDFI